MLQKLIDSIDHERFDPTLLVLSEPSSQFSLPEAHLLVIPHMRYRSYVFHLARLFRRQRYSIVSCHLGLLMTPLVYFANVLSGSRSLIIYTIHSAFDIYSYKQTSLGILYKFAISLALTSATRITTVSEGMKGMLSNVFGLSAIDVLPVPIYAAGHLSQRAHKNAISILSIGRLNYPKDFSTLLKSFQIVKKSIPDVQLTIIGDGPDMDTLRDEAKSLRISEEVFAGEKMVDRSTFEKADIFILSSRSESLGIVLIEAMAYGVPVIATACEFGPKELIDDGKTGLLVPISDAEAMAHAVERLMLDKKLYSTIRECARTAVEKYEERSASAEWERFFSDVANTN